jgi:hypothetical protein
MIDKKYPITERYCNKETCIKIQEHITGLRVQNEGFYAPTGVIYSWETAEDFFDEKVPVYTQSVALRWMNDMHKRHVEFYAYPHEDGCFYWAYAIFYLNDKKLVYHKEFQKAGFDSKEDAAEAAINYFLDNIIDD